MGTVIRYGAGVSLLVFALAVVGIVGSKGWLDNWLSGVTAVAGDTRADYAAMRQATVLVRADGGHGSGALIGKRLVITAAHVVRDAETITVVFSDDAELTATVGWRGGGKADIAGLILAEDAPALPASLSCRDLREGEGLTAMGNPLSARGVSSFLRVAGVGPWNDTVPGTVPVVGSIATGMSGGPTFDEGGFVVGVVTAFTTMVIGGSPSPTGFGIVYAASSLCDALPTVAQGAGR